MDSTAAAVGPPTARLPDGPSGTRLSQSLQWVFKPAEFMNEARARYGKRFTARFIHAKNYVLLCDPADVKAVFTGPPEVFPSGKANEHFAPYFGKHSIFAADGERHRHLRRVMGPPLRGERIHHYGELIRDLTYEAMATWPQRAVFRAMDETRKITLQVILRALVGARNPELTARITELAFWLTHAAARMSFLRIPTWDLGAWSPWGRFVRQRREFDRLLEMLVRPLREGGTQGHQEVLAKLVEGAAHGGYGKVLGDAYGERLRAFFRRTLLAPAETAALVHPAL